MGALLKFVAWAALVVALNAELLHVLVNHVAGSRQAEPFRRSLLCALWLGLIALVTAFLLFLPFGLLRYLLAFFFFAACGGAAVELHFGGRVRAHQMLVALVILNVGLVGLFRIVGGQAALTLGRGAPRLTHEERYRREALESLEQAFGRDYAIEVAEEDETRVKIGPPGGEPLVEFTIEEFYRVGREPREIVDWQRAQIRRAEEARAADARPPS